MTFAMGGVPHSGPQQMTNLLLTSRSLESTGVGGEVTGCVQVKEKH